MSLEEQYYNLLTRTDHPVFKRDFVDTTTIGPGSPLNSVINLVIARQLVKLKATLDEIALNEFPDTPTALGIDQWEETYFGFVKSGVSLPDRITQLLDKINTRFTMSAPDVVRIAQSITGKTPTVTRSVAYGGWILGQGILGLNTILGSSSMTCKVTYLVVFTTSIPSNLLAELDAKLTKIEKGGSTHIIIAPVRYWILGQGILGVDTRLR